MAKGKKDEKKEEKKEKVELPEIRDKEGNLFKLKRTDFPMGKEGNVAWCQYQIERWTEKKEKAEKSGDPKQKKLDKLARLEKAMEDLKAELAELED